jgi:hypothetical protein
MRFGSCLSIFAILFLCTACSPELIYQNDTDDKTHDLALKLSLKMASKKANAQIALVRIQKLPPAENINALAEKKFLDLGIGKRTKGRGVLILHSAEEHLAKVEVGYALEGELPDLALARLESAAASYFLSSVPQDYFSELLITLSNTLASNKILTAGEGPLYSWNLEKLSGGAGVRSELAKPDPEAIKKAVLLLEVDAKNLEYTAANSAAKTLSLYLRSLEKGIGDPSLPLLTEGSRVFRVLIPRSIDHQKRIADYYLRAKGFKLFEKENEALAVFDRGSSTLPVYLVRGQDFLWRVDEVKMWTYYHRFEDSTEFYFLADSSPFRDELLRDSWPTAKCSIHKARIDIPRTSFSNGQASGDWFLFEVGNLPLAREAYAAEVKAEPESKSTRWKLFHVLTNLSQVEDALEQLQWLYQRSEPRDHEIRLNYFFYRRAYREAEIQASRSIFEIIGLNAFQVYDFLRQIALELYYAKEPRSECDR